MEPTLRQQYDQWGYAIAPHLFSTAEIARLTALIDPIYAQWLQENQAAVIDQQLINMQALTHPRYFESCGRQRLQLFEQIASQNLTQLLQDMFGSGIYFHNTQLFFNPHSADKRPYWHRDLQYSSIDDATLAREQHRMTCLHVRIPLMPEIGIELIPGTHRRWDTELEHDVRLEFNGHRNHEGLPGATLLPLNRGDVLIFNANMIHRGNYALNPCRKALDLCLGKPHPLMLQHFDAAILPAKSDLPLISHSDWYQESFAMIPTLDHLE